MGERAFRSLPPREAWIEIIIKTALFSSEESRFPRGKRGLKSGERGGQEAASASNTKPETFN